MLLNSVTTLRTLLLGALLFVALPLSANTPQQNPGTMLEEVTEQMLDVLKREREVLRARPDHLFELVEEILVPYVDMERMARWVLGKHWRSANATQRERFTREFKTLLVRFYVSAILDDPKQLDSIIDASDKGLVTYLPGVIEEAATKANVRAEVNLPTGAKIPVSFMLYRDKGAGWKVIDVNVDGISLVTNYRSTFDTEVSRDGLEAVIGRLAQRNKDLIEQAANGKQAKAGSKVQ